jgi:spore germination cell wall hydrolase CwlJ-like protein
LTTSDAGAPSALSHRLRLVAHVVRRHVHATPKDLRQNALQAGLLAVMALAACVAVRGALSNEMATERAVRVVKAPDGYSDRVLAALMAEAGPGALAIAANHHPDRPMHGVWGRPAGWERLEVSGPPNLGLDHLTMAEAERINGVIPDSHAFNPPAEPFVLRASARERDEAVKCLTTAIYYEAALEPREGQEAVAQVVLNRLRHPGYPKSVCGVVFQGADRPGCQFSFACDGSMAREPAAWAWRNSRDVAIRALNGFVMEDVGTATHYHTTWIRAGWTPTLLKVRQVGSQIFFRPLGPDGAPAAFTERYQGGEARMSKVSLIGKPEAAINAPPALMRVSTVGSTVAPKSVVVGGRLVVLPGNTVFLNGRLRSVLVNPNGAPAQAGPQSQLPPMHAMIALRAQAAKAAQPPQVVQTARGPVPAIPPLAEAPIIELPAGAAN